MKKEQTWAFYIKFRYSKIYFRSFKTNQEHKCPELEHRMLFYSAPSQHTSGQNCPDKGFQQFVTECSSCLLVRF